LKRVFRIALGLWLVRWAVREFAPVAAQRWARPGPLPKDSPVRPGWMDMSRV
jgi:hypothetical protein